MLLNIELLRSDIKVPVQQAKSIGYDLFSPEEFILDKHEIRKVPLGFKVQFDTSYGAFIWDRSGISLKGITTLAGVIEGSYTDEWAVVLANISEHAYQVKKGDRIAQIVFLVYNSPEVKVVDKIKVDIKRSGFGSTGV